MDIRRTFVIGFTVIFILLFAAFKNKSKTKPLIYYPEINKNIDPPKKYPGTRAIILRRVDSAEVEIYNDMGKSYLKLFQRGGNIKYEGEYIESIGLLHRYIEYMDPNSLEKSIRIQEYYQPLKDGKWIYYNDTGKIIKEVTYAKGIVKDSIIK